MKTGINVLSLFDGMSCGQIALERAGIKANKYFAAEIDKPAISVCLSNYPNTIQVGDVTKVFAKELPKIDLIIGGSPCQGFSFAGAGLNFNDPRSALFFEFVRLVNECRKINPDIKFLLENVNMKREYLRVISEYLGVFPVNINSNLVSAQNRNRWYWSNIKTKQVGLFSETWTDIPQPKDKGILLKDILQPENEINKKYYLNNVKFDFIGMKLDAKSNTLRTGEHNSQSKKHNFDLIKIDTKGNIKPNQDKASCFTAGAHSGGNHSDMDLICVAMRGRNPENPSDRKTGSPTEQRLELKEDGKTNCLTSVSKDNLIMLNERQKANHKNEDENANAFLSTCWKGSQADGTTLVGTTKIRRLTPTECERLQTVPDNYTACVSDTQRYKMLGNGWTVDVITHIFNYL